MIENIERFTQLQENLAYQIDYTANFNRSFRREFQMKYISKDISPDEFAILYAITNVPDITQSELAKLLFKGKAHIGKILNDMETRGIIKRAAETRGNIIIKRNIITPVGAEIYEKGNKEFQRIKSIMKKEFSDDDIKQFILYLRKFREVLNSIVDVKLK